MYNIVRLILLYDAFLFLVFLVCLFYYKHTENSALIFCTCLILFQLTIIFQQEHGNDFFGVAIRNIATGSLVVDADIFFTEGFLLDTNEAETLIESALDENYTFTEVTLDATNGWSVSGTFIQIQFNSTVLVNKMREYLD